MKWICTIIYNKTIGKYRAIMEVNGRSIDNLPVDVDYNTLKNEIKRITGKEILKRKDMIFERLSNYELIATIDAASCRKDCRVTIAERKNGWKPLSV